MQTILVTGGSGFIGSMLIRSLLETTTYQIINVDKLSYAANPMTLVDVENHPRYVLKPFDINDKIALEKLFEQYRPNVVFHLAAESHVDNSIDAASVFIHSNINGTFHLLEVCRNYWEKLPQERADLFRFIHVSTDEVYGSLEIGDDLFHENSPYAPSSPYSASKAASDHLVSAWAKTYGLPIIITHCSNNYGPYQFPEKLIPKTIIRMLEGRGVPVYGDGKNRRDWIHVEDHVAALQMIWKCGEVGEVYNISSQNELTNIEVVQMIANQLGTLRPSEVQGGYQSLIQFTADRPGHDFRYAIDNQKVCMLGWKPKKTFQQGLAETILWYVKRKDWWKALSC